MSAYCEPGEVSTLGINAEAIADIDPTVISNEIQAQSALMDTYFIDRLPLLLTAWDLSVKKCCAVLTGVELLRTRGYSPEADESVREARDQWTSWLKGVADGRWRPTVTGAVTPPINSGYYGAQVVTAKSRGLSVRGTGRCRQPFQGD